ncbi:hypothetical protein L615_000100001240 [Nocardioides sp. J9]|uniref:hypothetical protein n=1 Tax=unclassified Nocardioides TaxID=2615069 RepID=UPI00048A7796|nr:MULTISPECIES: hypothetical protein [unclassified Nocardioides]TWH04969.1 hypothetical protein L615_000100001240 [Nocardioides sp. J9]
MTVPATAAPARSASPTRTGALVTAGVALVIALLETAFGAWCWMETEAASVTNDDPLVGIGFLIALFIGVPGLVGLLLAVLGWVFARHVAGLVLAILAAVVVSAPLLFLLGTGSLAY